MTQLQYSTRGRRSHVDSGIRRVAPTFGKQLLLTSSEKAGATIAVESVAERFVSHAFELDPDAREVRAQPFTLDLSDGSILRTPEQKAESRAKHKRLGTEPVFYTPDFGLTWSHAPTCVEVSVQGLESSGQKSEKLPKAREWLAARGWNFVHLVVPSYWRNPLLANVPLLRQALTRRELFPGGEVVERMDLLASQGAQTIGDYCAGLGVDARLVPVLVVSGALCVDVAKYELCFATPATPAGGSLDHLQVLKGIAQ